MIDRDASVAELREIFAKGTEPAMHKADNDLRRYEMVITGTAPDVLVETGLLFGGSHLWFAQRVPKVITVESDPESIEKVRTDAHGLGPPPDNGLLICGDSTDDRTVESVLAALHPSQNVMVVLDSDHSTEHVYAEMMRYGRLVTPGCYLVVEDGILHYLEPGPWPTGNWYEGDPLLAIERYLAWAGDWWEVDRLLEDLFPTTQHPSGWLRRTDAP